MHLIKELQFQPLLKLKLNNQISICHLLIIPTSTTPFHDPILRHLHCYFISSLKLLLFFKQSLMS